MSLNIKNEEAHQMAQELASLTGESMTTAVTKAIRERLERTRRRSQKYENVMAIARECAAHLKQPWKSTDPDEMLYDEMGLPK